MKTAVCRMCGTQVQTEGKYIKYCQTCREKHDKIMGQRRNKVRREREHMRKLGLERMGRSSLSEANKAARAAGLSYGQWVARGCP